MSEVPAFEASRSRSFVLCTVAYGVAGITALVVGSLAPVLHPIATALLADVAATVAIFAFSWKFDNSSFYDPYWSVAPLPIALYWMFRPETIETSFPRQACVLALIAWWGVRLTYNWARGWQGLSHEDWRYVDKRAEFGRAYWLISLLGIHLVPTLVVFAGCLPLYAVFAGGDASFGAWDVLAIGITATFIAIESRADRELLRFRRGDPEPDAFLAAGLWSRCRHPNYLGEIGFWWGLYAFALAADPTYWWTIAGPLSITILFSVISLPLIDARMVTRRPAYAEHMKTMPALVPIGPRRSD
jgi:steroid 5-alpha reductase family enzyme